jgi:hypothetical protein
MTEMDYQIEYALDSGPVRKVYDKWTGVVKHIAALRVSHVQFGLNGVFISRIERSKK